MKGKSFKDSYKPDFYAYQNENTARIGKLLVCCGFPMILLFTLQDIFIIKQPVLLYFRLIFILPFLFYAISVFFIFPDHKNFVLPVHSAALLSLNLSMLSILYYFAVVLRDKPEDTQAVINAYIVVLFITFVVSGAARKFYIGLSVIPFVLFFTAMACELHGNLKTLSYLSSPMLLLVVLSVFSFVAEQKAFQDFFHRSMDEERKEQLKEQIENQTKLFNELQNTVDENKQISEELLNEIMYDSLTEAFNRNQGYKKLVSDFEFIHSIGGCITLCYVDVDMLKHYNDTYGHKQGDEFLRLVVSRIKSNIGVNDYIIRMGGDEFLVVFNGFDKKSAKAKMNNTSEELRQYSQDGIQYDFSCGYSEFFSGDDITIEQLIILADEDMYIHKNSKRDRCGQRIT